MSGEPLEARVKVLSCRDDASQRSFGELRDALGAAVAVRIGGVDVVLNSVRQQVFSPDCFTQMGIDPAAKRFVVVKSTQHFRAHFDPIAGATVYCDAPGALNANLAALPYRNLRRPLWLSTGTRLRWGPGPVTAGVCLAAAASVAAPRAAGAPARAIAARRCAPRAASVGAPNISRSAGSAAVVAPLTRARSRPTPSGDAPAGVAVAHGVVLGCRAAAQAASPRTVTGPWRPRTRGRFRARAPGRRLSQPRGQAH
jgi:hypothetical protein